VRRTTREEQEVIKSYELSFLVRVYVSEIFSGTKKEECVKEFKEKEFFNKLCRQFLYNKLL
jgi:hypothetical protein